MADENENIEDEIVVETDGDEEASSGSDSGSSASAEPDGDELDSYSKGVQNRIKKLTEKYRQEERDKAEALRLSQQLMEENKRLKSRVQSLDSGYLNEYKNRLATQEAAAKQAYKQAVESGDPDAMLAAQEALSNLAVEKSKLQGAEQSAKQQRVIRKKPVADAQPAPQPQPQRQAQPPKPDPKAQSWAERNEWFGQDRIMTTAAFAIHQQLVEDEGFDPSSDEYYNEIDGRLRREFPHKFEKAKKSGGASQVASAGNSASRSTKQGRRSVKLTHSQVAIAKKLGVPLEEYAKYVKE